VEAAHQTTELVVRHVAANDIVIEVLRFVHEMVEELKIGLDAKVDELLFLPRSIPLHTIVS